MSARSHDAAPELFSAVWFGAILMWQFQCGVWPVRADRSTHEDCMAIVDLESLSIEELAALRDDVTEKLAEKVAVRLGNVPIVFQP
jgi:hypothetical protein